MYEMRQEKIQKMKQKKWFSYALLAVAIFLFSQGTAIIDKSMEAAIPVLLISFILHTNSVGDLTERIFKIKYSKAANIAMLIALSTAAAVCYIKKFNILYIVLLNFAAIAIYIIFAAIFNKSKSGE
ncbi:MAG: hypothetical protein K0R07_1221 [Sedimentibacter sp.]|jgi:hypothetical protein|nr:hypothetical protein [Sedimentibacter sp.]